MRVARDGRFVLTSSFAKLALGVLLVDEATLLKKEPFTPPSSRPRPSVQGSSRPAQLDGESEVEDYVSEGRVPLDDRAVLVPRRRDRLGRSKTASSGSPPHSAKCCNRPISDVGAPDKCDGYRWNAPGRARHSAGTETFGLNNSPLQSTLRAKTAHAQVSAAIHGGYCSS